MRLYHNRRKKMVNSVFGPSWGSSRTSRRSRPLNLEQKLLTGNHPPNRCRPVAQQAGKGWGRPALSRTKEVARALPSIQANINPTGLVAGAWARGCPAKVQRKYPEPLPRIRHRTTGQAPRKAAIDASADAVMVVHWGPTLTHSAGPISEHSR